MKAGVQTNIKTNTLHFLFWAEAHYELDGVADAESIYRLVTTILDHQKTPAKELAALYHEAGRSKPYSTK